MHLRCNSQKPPVVFKSCALDLSLLNQKRWGSESAHRKSIAPALNTTKRYNSLLLSPSSHLTLNHHHGYWTPMVKIHPKIFCNGNGNTINPLYRNLERGAVCFSPYLSVHLDNEQHCTSYSERKYKPRLTFSCLYLTLLYLNLYSENHKLSERN